MKTIVFLTGSYFPDHSAVSNCIERVILKLENSFNIIVICPQTDKNQPLTEIHNNHKIIRFSYKNMDNKLVRRMKRISNKYSLLDDLTNGYLNEIEKIETIDTIVPAVMPFETAIASYKAKEKNYGLKVVPFMFDPFSNNSNLHYHKLLKKIKMKNLLEIESSIIESSHYLLLIHHLKQHFIEKHNSNKEKYVFVEHPLFEKDFYDSVTNTDKNNIKVVYTGSFYKKIRNPEYFLKVMNHVIKKSENIHLHIYSFGDCKKIIKKWSEVNTKIIDHNSVTSDIAREKMKTADLLIGVGNSTSSQTPSKIFEYISFKKKIIYFIKNKNDRNIEILKKYPYALLIEESNKNLDEVSNEVNKFIEKTSNNNIEIDEEINQIFEDASPNYIADIIKRNISLKY